MSLRVDIERRQGAFDLQVAFTVECGLTALFGPSGSGKTTIVNAIAGLVRPDRGRIALDDAPLFDASEGVWIPPHRRQVGYVFQEARLFPHLSVRANLLYARRFGGRSSGGASLAHVVDLLDIGRLLDRSPDGLSGGEKQRVAIGRALLSHPRLLLMDEPLASLDETRKQEILPYIERLRDEGEAPIVYVSHAVAEVRRLAGMVVTLEHGRVTACGPPKVVLPASGAREAGNAATHVFIDARVSGRPAAGFVRLATPAGDLLAEGDFPLGARVRAQIVGRDLLLASERAPASTAWGALAAEVARVEEDGPWRRVIVRLAGQEIAVRAAAACMEELAVSAGSQIVALAARAEAEAAD